MDEPLGALDKKLREQMQFEIKHIHANLGVTVVYVTHDQAEALTMSDRIAVFNEGVVQQLATPKELYERPRNAFVAQFIGENNRLPGTVVDLNDAACTVTVAGGATVEALPVNVAESGARTTLSLRPERVVIGPKTELCENVFEATVAELVYIGDHIRARVDCLGHDDFIVKVPNSLDTPDLRPGARIRIGWRRQDCAALDAS
jgi:putative spermidine/putrescine transport system ATP-binding protein